MIRKSAHRWFIGVLGSVVTLLVASTAARAGQNTFTGSLAVGSGVGADLIAADPSNPYVVYAVFQPVLYRSSDGGRTWLRSKGGFNFIYSVLVHPAEPSTVYISTAEGNAIPGVYKSTDSGVSWTKTPLDDFVQVLAGDPSDASTVYAGSFSGRIWKSTDEGAHWASGQNLSGIIAQLVVDPHERKNVYVGTESDYYYFNFGEFAKSTDSAATFSPHIPGPFKAVSALAIDPLSPSNLYMGLQSDDPTHLRGLCTSKDAGTTWTQSRGLREGVVSTIVADPHHSGTVYAGTPHGVFRSLDAGATWAPFGPKRLGLSVNSLTLGGDGRFLHAGTDEGTFDLEFVQGPVDVSGGPSGDSRVLVWSADKLALSNLDASGNWSDGGSSAASTTWIATAIAVGADGHTRVLWQCQDGRWGLEMISPIGSESVTFSQATVDPTDIAVAADGQTWILFTGGTGQMFVTRMDAFSAPRFGHAYGPAQGWSAVAIADSPEGAWVLWRCTDGRAGLSLHDAGGAMLRSFQWTASAAGFAAEDITVGADGHPRLLRTNSGGSMEIWTVDASGQLAAGQSYDNTGFTARRISAGADGLTRALWNAPDGHGSVWLLNSDNTVSSKHDTGVSAQPPPPPPPNVAGTWTGIFVPADDTCLSTPTSADAVFEQNGSTVTGTLDTDGNSCGFRNVHFEGSVLGRFVSGGVTGDRFAAGSTARGQVSNVALELTLTNTSGSPMGGKMTLRRIGS